MVVVERLGCECRELDFFGEQRPSRLDGRIASADPPILPALVKLAHFTASLTSTRVRDKLLLRIEPARIFDRNADQPSWCY